MHNEPDNAAEVTRRLDEQLRLRPHFAERIHRELLMTLHRRGIASIDSIHDEARKRAGLSKREILDDPNQAERDRWDERERELVESVTREYVARHFVPADVDDVVNLTLKREEVQSLEYVATKTNASFRELADKVQRFCELPPGETKLAPAEVVGTRVALIRHFVSDQLEFIGIAKNHLKIRDFDDITRRTLGSDRGMGRIGGKAGGMLLAHRILADLETDDEPYLPVAIPDSYYLRSDVVEDFLRLNRLDEYQNQKYKPIEDVAREYPLIRGVFRNGDFPLKVVHQLRRILADTGTDPLIVRSSSLLEDRFGTAFCGKYASVFVANQGTVEQRLRALFGAIAEVYASVMAPDPILYRREHNLIDYVEEMAVLIQRVVGVRFGDFLFPPIAGVAFSRNEYRWSPRIKREDGLMRIVMGLGTRAVDRSGSEYPRMVALGAPTLRAESDAKEILRCAQRTVDVMDLKRNRLRSIRLPELLASGRDLPMLDKIVSVARDDELYMPPTQRVDADPAALCITFDKLLRATPFVERVREMLARLENVYGVPVDLEFATDGEKFYVLQCRTQSQAADCGPVTIPSEIPHEDVVFDAHRHVRTALVEGIEYIVYIDSATYNALPSREARLELARVVGRINHKLPAKSFVLIGPGRWGSNDIRLGVPVRYADINHCCMLIEVARQKDGFAPEVSFGTHFFQDLVEAGIHYLPLYPDEEGNRFNEAFFKNAPNALIDLLPDDAAFQHSIHVIHVPAASGGRTLTVAMDAETDHAVAHLTR
ncbi:MAG: pyruvate, phosphate dikinase [Deltaproteobacteria bacterium]|nr:pyruvate, phosphate dikinase [Deltaproteobacteria bacterium]